MNMRQIANYRLSVTAFTVVALSICLASCQKTPAEKLSETRFAKQSEEEIANNEYCRISGLKENCAKEIDLDKLKAKIRDKMGAEEVSKKISNSSFYPPDPSIIESLKRAFPDQVNRYENLRHRAANLWSTEDSCDFVAVSTINLKKTVEKRQLVILVACLNGHAASFAADEMAQAERNIEERLGPKNREFASQAGNVSDPPRDEWGKNVLWIERSHAALRARLRDGSSAKFRNDRVVQSQGGHMVCGEFNAKNGFGGYSGFSRYFGSGDDIIVIEEDMAPGEFEKAWTMMCS